MTVDFIIEKVNTMTVKVNTVTLAGTSRRRADPTLKKNKPERKTVPTLFIDSTALGVIWSPVILRREKQNEKNQRDNAKFQTTQR